jgi:hypothetical protein
MSVSVATLEEYHVVSRLSLERLIPPIKIIPISCFGGTSRKIYDAIPLLDKELKCVACTKNKPHTKNDFDTYIANIVEYMEQSYI